MKRQNFSWRYAIAIGGVVLLAYLVMAFNSRMADMRRLAVQKDRVSTELVGLEATRAALETQIAYANSEAAVQEWAYQEGNMIREGDVPVVPLPPPGSTPVPTPTPSVIRAQVSNWQMWMWLFVDEQASQGASRALP